MQMGEPASMLQRTVLTRKLNSIMTATELLPFFAITRKLSVKITKRRWRS